MEKVKGFLSSKLTIVILGAFIAIFLALFSILAIKGSYSRYAQDDYCYGYRFRVDNFWNAQVKSYFGMTEYNSNRYALTMFNGLAELVGGPKFAPFMPALVMVSWICILVYIISLFLRNQSNILISITAALSIVFLTFILSPNIYQILFWLASINTYTTPMVISTLIFGRILHFTYSGKFTILNVVELALLNLLAGGFSETVTAWLLTLWFCVFVVLFFFSRKGLFKKARWPLIVAITATLIAMIIMLLNPTNSARAAFYRPQNLIDGLWRSFSYGLLFIKRSLKFEPVPFGFVILMGFWLSTRSKAVKMESWMRWLLMIAALLAVTFLLCAADMAPSVFLNDSYPGDRQLFPATFTLVFGLLASGWFSAKFLASFASRVFSLKIANAALFALAVLLMAYLGTTFQRAYDKLPLYQARAAAWDNRQQMILDSKSAGQLKITVPAFDSIYGITELGANSNNWVNRCAARYYGVESIAAEDGYMGIKAYPIGK